MAWLIAMTLAAAASCDAPARTPHAEDCVNGIDDDGNGKLDCADAACAASLACGHEICGNLLDDDHDGLADCADTDCSAGPTCTGPSCGNGHIDLGEACDGGDLAGRSCTSFGFPGGALACSSECGLDTTGCTGSQPPHEIACGNGLDDDGDGLVDCADSNCALFPGCACGNHVLDADELCDGPLFGEDETCVGLGFSGGTLACRATCDGYDTSGCTPPVCGDGVISPGETCDDGNTMAGDGCDATCQPELQPICSMAAPLALGANPGDTTDGSNVLDASCILQGGRERIFSFTPAQSGTLSIVLSSSADLGLSVRSTCVDAASERGCANLAGGGSSESLSFPVTAGAPLTVLVDGERGEAGPFTLILTLTP